MEVGEVLLADRLREKGEPIDLVFAHHPEGPGYANLHEVMYMQADLWAKQGVSIAAGDSLIAPRAEEIRRRIAPVNHYRAIDAAVLLGLASLSCHTPADNSVQAFVQAALRREADPRRLGRRREVAAPHSRVRRCRAQGLRTAPDQRLRSVATGPHRRRHDRRNRRSHRRADRLSAAGVGTLVGMHYSEEHQQARRGAQAQSGDRRAYLERRSRHEPRAGPRSSALAKIAVYCTSGMVRVARI